MRSRHVLEGRARDAVRAVEPQRGVHDLLPFSRYPSPLLESRCHEARPHFESVSCFYSQLES